MSIFKKSILLSIVCLLFSCASTHKLKDQNNQAILERWKKAVIQLEGASDSVSDSERSQRWFGLSQQRREGKISDEEFLKASQDLNAGSRDIRYQGTAIFMEHEGRHYLITARHVLFDELSAKRILKEEAEQLRGAPAQFRESLMKSAENQIFRIIFRVPSIDEILQGQGEKHRQFLMNLGAGGAWPYTFSKPEIDLAIISLYQRDSHFVEELKSLGYQPIHLSDISDEPSSEGAEVFTVGFPTFTTYRLDLTRTISGWSSAFTSTPNFAFGKVSMLHEKLNYFWCDISIYPGNSGGPVIENNKLVGIVSKQAEMPIERIDNKTGREQDPTMLYRIPFGTIIKAKFLKPLIEEQIQKDSQWKKTRP